MGQKLLSNVVVALAALLSFSQMVRAEVIANDISSISFSTEQSPYIVKQNILVPRGKSVTIPSGVVFCFDEGTGLIVEGSLQVEGSMSFPVVFTSIHDSTYNPHPPQPRILPNPFDWSGILLTDTGGPLKMRNFSIRFATIGLNIEDTIAGFELKNGVFSHSGQGNLMMQKSIVTDVHDNVPYSKGSIDKLSVVRRTNRGEKSSKMKRIIRYTLAGLTVASLSTAVLMVNQGAETNQEMASITPSTPGATSETYAQLETDRRMQLGIGYSLLGLSGLSLLGAGITFTF